MSDFARFTPVLLQTAIVFPRGVLGADARVFADAIITREPEARLDALRDATAAAHWDDLRLAMGTALERVFGDDPDPLAREAIELTLDKRPDNPLARALAEEAGRSLAAVMERNTERLAVLERRLTGGASPDAELAVVIGEIVVDLLDLDPPDYEDEITAYLGAGETAGARRELARSTGDEESRTWARDELRQVDSPDAPVTSRAVQVLAAGDPPEDPAEDAVWVAAMLALVEQAVEIAVVAESTEDASE
jgi:hypothetical protein